MKMATMGAQIYVPYRMRIWTLVRIKAVMPSECLVITHTHSPSFTVSLGKQQGGQLVYLRTPCNYIPFAQV